MWMTYVQLIQERRVKRGKGNSFSMVFYNSFGIIISSCLIKKKRTTEMKAVRG